MNFKMPTDHSRVVVVKKKTFPSLIKKPIVKDTKPIDVK